MSDKPTIPDTSFTPVKEEQFDNFFVKLTSSTGTDSEASDSDDDDMDIFDKSISWSTDSGTLPPIDHIKVETNTDPLVPITVIIDIIKKINNSVAIILA